MDWMGPVHFGTWAGAWSKALNVVIGLAPTLLAVTGTWMWLKRRRARSAALAGAARRRPAATGPAGPRISQRARHRSAPPTGVGAPVPHEAG